MVNKGEQLTDEARAIFSEGIALILTRWDTLVTAVENECGGPNSRRIADQLHSDIFNWFTIPSKEPRYADELENMLLECLDDLGMVLQDGSDEEVAHKLMIMYEECLEGNYLSIERLREKATVPRPSVSQVLNDDEDDDDDDDGSMQIDDSSNIVVDVPKPRSNTNSASTPSERLVEPEDGWQVVSSRRRRN